MYVPKHFEITEPAVLHRHMERFSFATLVTVHNGLPFASHLPFMIRPDVGECGLLIAHMARANDQWQDFEQGAEALVIFQGQHAYISPSWYRNEPNVPTWNYLTVHAYGVPRIIDDEARIADLLRELVATNEAQFDEPWPMDLSRRYLHGRMRAIVMFEIPIGRLEGKFKLNQNHPTENRAAVVAALSASDDAQQREIAAVMAAMLEG